VPRQRNSLFEAAAPQGGIEITDITDINKPKEIGLTSHRRGTYRQCRPQVPQQCSGAVTRTPSPCRRTDNDKDETKRSFVRRE